MIVEKYRFILLVTVLFLFANCKKIAPDFTYSPEAPKAGEAVTFTNNTTEGENWNWAFGDGGTSTAKSPTKTYRKPGVYDVTLRVDSNDHFVKTKQITIYDTIPAIYTETEEIKYYEPFTVSVLAYNPYDYTMTYEWHFSDNAVSDDIENNVATTSTVTLFFTEFGQQETISLTVTIGDDEYNISSEFRVTDVKARSLIMATDDGQILRQRIYANGREAARPTDFDGQGINSLQAESDRLYTFGENGIHMIDMETAASQTIVSTAIAGQPFCNGFVSGNRVLWTDDCDHLYETTVAADQEMTGADDFAIVSATCNNGQNGGCAYYDDTYFLAKKETGTGIYRFRNDQGTISPIDTILTSFAVQAFAIDEVQQKIYFSVPETEANKGLWVCGMDGSRPFQIAEDCTRGIVIDYQSDRVYWTGANTVMYCSLSKNTQNTIDSSTIGIFAEDIQVSALALDREPK